MVCFVNVESVDRIIYSIFQRFNLEWKTRTLSVFTQELDVTHVDPCRATLDITPYSNNNSATSGHPAAL